MSGIDPANIKIDMEKLYKKNKQNKIPYRCPVCWGNGIVPNGFYLSTSGQNLVSDAAPEKCRSCNGTGIVWG
jgi:rubrerythrin